MKDTQQGGVVDGGSLSRQKILDVAGSLLAEMGYRGTTLADISDALGVTRQAIYYYFRSKDAVVAALYLHLLDELEQSAVDAARDATNDAERFDRMLENHFRTVAERPELSAIFIEGAGNLPTAAKAQVRQARRNYTGILTEAYSVAAAQGRFRTSPAAHVAVSLLLGSANWLLRWYRSTDAGSPDELARGAVDLLRGGYAQPDQNDDRGT